MKAQERFRIIAESSIYAFDVEVSGKEVIQFLTRARINFCKMKHLPSYQEYEAKLKVTIIKL